MSSRDLHTHRGPNSQRGNNTQRGLSQRDAPMSHRDKDRDRDTSRDREKERERGPNSHRDSSSRGSVSHRDRSQRKHRDSTRGSESQVQGQGSDEVDPGSGTSRREAKSRSSSILKKVRGSCGVDLVIDALKLSCNNFVVEFNGIYVMWCDCRIQVISVIHNE